MPDNPENTEVVVVNPTDELDAQDDQLTAENPETTETKTDDVKQGTHEPDDIDSAIAADDERILNAHGVLNKNRELLAKNHRAQEDIERERARADRAEAELQALRGKPAAADPKAEIDNLEKQLDELADKVEDMPARDFERKKADLTRQIRALERKMRSEDPEKLKGSVAEVATKIVSEREAAAAQERVYTAVLGDIRTLAEDNPGIYMDPAEASVISKDPENKQYAKAVRTMELVDVCDAMLIAGRKVNPAMLHRSISDLPLKSRAKTPEKESPKKTNDEILRLERTRSAPVANLSPDAGKEPVTETYVDAVRAERKRLGHE